ncbi:MAG: GntR family transcriptional regulator, transcriptional repressor for pyruvate dehydrogenase complex [Thermoleophilaceae bacterium]|jgi:GntR family transcriptional repressor for pyruvate dehydrogenase complex|nr:GntR family transcriptional regulator, transcriptional repressor for pyruvate dehydrogenase complex [Thermoleophilaceae bacterium]
MSIGVTHDTQNAAGDRNLFGVLEQTTMPERVRQELLAAIRDGRLPRSEPLPTQDELAAQFGVSRTVIREALRLMEASGAVVVRPGRRAVVASTPAAAVRAGWADWLAAHRDEVVELLSVRAAIERLAAARAAASADQATVGALRNNVRELAAAAADADTERVVALDVEFHHMVAAASGSALLLRLVDELAHAVEGSRTAAFSATGRGGDSAREHARVVEAIAAQDPGAADAAMAAHLEAVVAAVASVRDS